MALSNRCGNSNKNGIFHVFFCFQKIAAGAGGRKTNNSGSDAILTPRRLTILELFGKNLI